MKSRKKPEERTLTTTGPEMLVARTNIRRGWGPFEVPPMQPPVRKASMYERTISLLLVHDGE